MKRKGSQRWVSESQREKSMKRKERKEEKRDHKKRRTREEQEENDKMMKCERQESGFCFPSSCPRREKLRTWRKHTSSVVIGVIVVVGDIGDQACCSFCGTDLIFDFKVMSDKLQLLWVSCWCNSSFFLLILRLDIKNNVSLIEWDFRWCRDRSRRQWCWSSFWWGRSWR